MDRSAADAKSSAPKNRKLSAKATLQAEEKKPDAKARPKLETATRPASRLGRMLIWLKRLAIASSVAGAVAVITLLFYVRGLEADLPSIAQLQGNYHPPQVTRILARDGSLLAEAFTERRTVVPLSELPPHVKLAVLAAEDANFYEHEGLNYWGIARAMLVNLRAGHTRQGGSTITQQVVKNLLLDSERTYKRKIREALLARRIEQELCPECTPEQRKDKILELYLNHIYFGHGRYGIEEAARDNFGKSAKDLSIAEAAMLAGLPAGPELFSPRKDQKKALTRRAFVLGQMHEKGFLTDAQYDAAMKEPLVVAPEIEANSQLAPEAVEQARRLLQKIDPVGAARGGYTITTTIDPKLEAAAREALRADLDAYDKRHSLLGPLKVPTVAEKKSKKTAAAIPLSKDNRPFEGTPAFEGHKVYVGLISGADDGKGTLDIQVGTVSGVVKMSDADRYNPQHLAASAFAPVGARMRVSLLTPVPENAANAKIPMRVESGPEGALVAIDARSREILALVGSYESLTGGLDRATQSKRQPGSTFKPIVYSYAIHSRRFTAASLIDVTPGTFGNYHPSNYEGWKGTDALRLREVLANSVNIGAVRVLNDVGPANVVDWGHALGIESTLKPDLSLALGSYEVTPLELAGAYTTFAAGGEYATPILVLKIVGPDGKEVPIPAPPPSHRVLDESEAYVITNMMTSVIDHGTGVRAKELKRPLAGKTGTSNQSKDAWFAGFSTEIAAVVWVGYDDGRPLGGREEGASAALPAWIDFMRAAHEKKPPSDFPRPAGVTTVSIDVRTGKLPFDGDTNVMDEVFLAGTEPTDTSDVDAGAANEDGGPNEPAATDEPTP
ncbi:MAG: PBP1A family penicillin-binding protein [Polyangiaceae bacterium]